MCIKCGNDIFCYCGQHSTVTCEYCGDEFHTDKINKTDGGLYVCDGCLSDGCVDNENPQFGDDQ